MSIQKLLEHNFAPPHGLVFAVDNRASTELIADTGDNPMPQIQFTFTNNNEFVVFLSTEKSVEQLSNTAGPS
jgi:hypothetical protein